MIKFLSRLLNRDKDARLIRKQIETARKAHKPVRHLQAALTELRHHQLRKSA